MSLRYVDDGASRSAGMDVWDRSTEVGLDELLPLLLARRDATGARRDSVEAELDELVGDGIGAHRVFLGSRDRSALLLAAAAALAPQRRGRHRAPSTTARLEGFAPWPRRLPGS